VNENNNVKEFFENINNNFEKDLELEKLKSELKKKFNEYQTTMKYMLADAPIEILCLEKSIEKILLDQGFLRIYDLFDVDFVKIKGFGAVRIRNLTASLDKFFSML
jgi:transcription-repair coupling factor (superfamily II helicase)